MNQSNVSGKFDQVAGKIKQGVGEAIGNERLANEGAADQVKGHAKEAWGNVKDTATDMKDSARATSDAHAEEVRLHTENTDHKVRNSVTETAAHLKNSINRGLDNMKENARR